MVKKYSVISEKSLSNLKKKIEDKEYYDAYALIISYINRCVAKKQHDEAIKISYDFCKYFIELKHNDLIANIGSRLIEVLKEFELPPTEDIINIIIYIFENCPQSEDNTKYSFIEKAIEWSSHESNPDSSYTLSLHASAGKIYFNEKQYGSAQNHLIYGSSSNDLVNLILNWSKEGYESEKDLYLLRLIIILLANKKVNLAHDIINNPKLNINFDQDNISPAIQLIYLLVEACRAKNSNFFNTIVSKYNLVIRRDPLLYDYIPKINKTVFDYNPSKKDVHITFFNNILTDSSGEMNLFNTLSNLLGITK